MSVSQTESQDMPDTSSSGKPEGAAGEGISYLGMLGGALSGAILGFILGPVGSLALGLLGAVAGDELGRNMRSKPDQKEEEVSEKGPTKDSDSEDSAGVVSSFLKGMQINHDGRKYEGHYISNSLEYGNVGDTTLFEFGNRESGYPDIFTTMSDATGTMQEAETDCEYQLESFGDLTIIKICLDSEEYIHTLVISSSEQPSFSVSDIPQLDVDDTPSRDYLGGFDVPSRSGEYSSDDFDSDGAQSG